MNTYRGFNAGNALVTLLIAAFVPTTGLAIEFASPVSYPVGTSPAAVVVADLDRDGKPDLAVANSGGGNVSILLGNGDGTYKPAANFDAGMASPTSIEVADFNNDGIPDLAMWSGTDPVSSPVSSPVSILLGKGDGTFQAPKSTALPAAVDQATLDFAIADFNLDHKPDLAVLVHDSSAGTSRILILGGNGDGTFRSPQQNSVVLNTIVLPNGKYLVSADFNNDAKPDLAVQVSGGIQILLGQGDGTFKGGATVPVAVGFVVGDLKVGDFNADGKVDLLRKSDAPNTSCTFNKKGTVSKIDLWLGNGDGSFRAEQLLDNAASCRIFTGEGFALQGSVIGAPSVGDFNGDGRLDLEYQISNFSRGKPAHNFSAIRLGRGDKTFSVPVPSENLLPSGVTFVAKDLNGDKLSDLVYLDGNNNAAVVLLNTSATSGADLGITGATAGPPTDGSSFSYTAEIMNEGPQDATGVTFIEVLPTGVTLVSATATQGSCNQSSGTVTCAIGSLATGLEATVTIAVTLKPTAANETLTTNMKVTANEPDLALANNTAAPSAAVFMLAVSTDGTGTGTVTSTPAGISCGATCSQGYLGNSTVTLTATPAPGSVFTGWDGDTSGGVDNVAMWGSQTVRATFDKAPEPPPHSVGGSGGGGAFTGLELCAMLLLWLWRAFVGRHLSQLTVSRWRPLERVRGSRTTRLRATALVSFALLLRTLGTTTFSGTLFLARSLNNK